MGHLKLGGEEAGEVAKSFPLSLSNTAVLRKYIFTGEVGANVKRRGTRAQAKDEWGQRLWPWQLLLYVVVNVRGDRQQLTVNVGFREECVFLKLRET